MRTAVIAFGIVALSRAAASQELPRTLGSTIDFRLVNSTALRGELLAAGRDSIWILPADGRARALPLSQIARVSVQQSGITAKAILMWAVVGGFVTGGALTGACSTVEDASCGLVLPATLFSWLLVGGLSAAMTGSGQFPLARTADGLRPYARFPQGLPVDFPLFNEQDRTTAPRDSTPSRSATRKPGG
jgi:hypothetical protein